MRIGIDVDGILADFNYSYCKLAVEVTGRNLFPQLPYAPPCWDYLQPLGYTPEEEKAIWGVIIASDSFWKGLWPYQDTDTVLKRLTTRWDDDIYFITNRPGKQAKIQTEVFLFNHGYTHPTVLVSGDKGPVAKGLKLDYFIDDKPSNCIDVADGSKETKVFMLNCTWNTSNIFAIEDITRVTSVGEFLDRIGV